ncbi:hypothetical protein ABTX85_38230 [Streptomyces sp. NPDC096097]|uniref:hypothetical protein n=1 Tax=Streptomyces sp. NPDC096097 TaxID=3155546 RepID=UPI0033311035
MASSARWAYCERAGIDLGSVAATDALTVTREFVTNALRHGGGLTLFRIAVTDMHLSAGDASTRTGEQRRGPKNHRWHRDG